MLYCSRVHLLGQDGSYEFSTRSSDPVFSTIMTYKDWKSDAYDESDDYKFYEREISI